MSDREEELLAERLQAHLLNWLGYWPPTEELVVTSSPYRELAGWDGRVRRFAGIATAEGIVVSVPLSTLPKARDIARSFGMAGLEPELGTLLGSPGSQLRSGVFRSCVQLIELEDIGEWLAPNDERLPSWLGPFNGDVLVVFDEEGEYAAGLGRKRHDQFCQEIAVGTEEIYRGRGLAKRLVAKAARQIFEEGCVATYQHAANNLSSARVAEGSGFPNRGWSSLGLATGEAQGS